MRPEYFWEFVPEWDTTWQRAADMRVDFAPLKDAFNHLGFYAKSAAFDMCTVIDDITSEAMEEIEQQELLDILNK